MHQGEGSTEDARALAGITAGRRSTLRAILSVVTFTLALGWTLETRGDTIVALLRHEIDVHGEPIYEPRHGVDREAIARIDFDRFHTHLVPDWLAEQSHADTPAGRPRDRGRALSSSDAHASGRTLTPGERE